MFSQLSYYIFSILISFIFTSKSVYGVTCAYGQRTCYDSSYSYNWCCQSSQACGSYYESCSYPTPSSNVSPALISVIIIFSLFTCITCLRCCIRSQQQQQMRTIYNSNAQRVTYPYQQQPTRQPQRVVHIRPVYNVGAAPIIHSTYEAPPPSYEAATRNLSPKYPSAPSYSEITTIGQMDTRV